jgi:hypothetical protein
VRGSRIVEVGLGRFSRKVPSVGGTIGAPVKDRRCEPSPLLGAMVVKKGHASAQANADLSIRAIRLRYKLLVPASLSNA